MLAVLSESRQSLSARTLSSSSVNVFSCEIMKISVQDYLYRTTTGNHSFYFVLDQTNCRMSAAVNIVFVLVRDTVTILEISKVCITVPLLFKYMLYGSLIHTYNLTLFQKFWKCY